MEKLDQNTVDDYFSIYSKIESRAEFLLSEYKRIRDEVFGDAYPKRENGFSTNFRSAEYVYFSLIDDANINYSGDEYWSYGGHESHQLTLPIQYITSDSYVEDFRNEFEEIKRKSELKIKLAEVEKKAKEKELYEQLKQKFEK